MTNIEMRLDDLDAKLDSIQRLITHAGAAPRTSPQASKPQPPKKKTISAKKVVAKKAAKRGKK
jgi:hypothetical protein